MTDTLSAKEIIHVLGLSPLDLEGGYFRSTYESKASLSGARPMATAIYFLLEAHSPSKFHKLLSEEFELANASELLSEYPGAQEIIRAFL